VERFFERGFSLDQSNGCEAMSYVFTPLSLYIARALDEEQTTIPGYSELLLEEGYN